MLIFAFEDGKTFTRRGKIIIENLNAFTIQKMHITWQQKENL
jgi:hypothetical protein